MVKHSSDILILSKNFLPKQTYKKLKGIENREEMLQVALYALKSALNASMYELENEIIVRESQKKDVFVAKHKLLHFKSKMPWLKTHHAHQEISKIISICQDLKKELKNV